MSPAASFILIVLVGSASWLSVTVAVPALFDALISAGQRIRPLSTPISVIMASILLLTAVRLAPGSASVPPPAERVIVNAQTSGGAMTIRNPFTERTAVGVRGQVHEVARGDSLWRIARTLLEEHDGEATGAEISTLWKAIYAANTDVIGGDPNLIYPGQVLTIPGGVRG